MSSLADLPELVGFFSYSREDDVGAFGALSALRDRIQHELRAQLGRTAKTFRIWQDKEAIPSGTLWETEIKNAVGQAAFFIPIITPTVVSSPFCHFELEAFLARESELGRDDLVFPILYIDVPALEDDARRKNDSVLSLIAKRQYVDWRRLRHRDVRTAEAGEAVELFCRDIRDALRRPWISPDERIVQEKAAALQRANDERKRQEAAAQRQEEEMRQQAAAARDRERADQERRHREEEAEQRRAQERRLREDARAKRQAENEERRLQDPAQTWLLWLRSHLMLVSASAIALAVIGVIGLVLAVWLPYAPESPVVPSPAPPSAPAPNPVRSTNIPVMPLSLAQEQALKPGDTFQECAKCPFMRVVPAAKAAQWFAVGQFEATFDEWDACVADGGCNGYKPNDEGWGRGRQPVIFVSWNDAKTYVLWLSKITHKPYRLLSSSEYEYATRAGTTTAYPWGEYIKLNGQAMADCNGCGSQWDDKKTAPVGSFAPNRFGLYDMVGNVLEWTEDCVNDSSTSTSCSFRVVRGGAWDALPKYLVSANQGGNEPDRRENWIGFRVARTLDVR